jgi:hypothetical protein
MDIHDNAVVACMFKATAKKREVFKFERKELCTECYWS